MMHGYKTIVPVDETATPLTAEQRANRTRQYLVLEEIIDAARNGDVDTVQALAAKL
jgi:hypothetical protein